MVLAAAAILADKIKRGKLLILFQPGEETLKGALAVIATGLMDKVDIAMGLHIRPIQDIPNGTMTPAICHGASTFAQVKILGKGCHGSRPHLGVNACDAVAAVINAVNAIKLNPVLAWSCKVTNIKAGGAAPNIIPDKAAFFEKIMQTISNSLPVVFKQYFLGVSDCSYCGVDSPIAGDYYITNTPIWGSLYSFDIGALNRVKIPFVLLGPWAKDLILKKG